jgi:ElaB/YqjD/DUF883 family membrane-anchored ribosome-binding protein
MKDPLMNIPSRISAFPSSATEATEATEAVAQEANRFGELARSWWARNANMLRDAAGTVRDEAAAIGSRTRLHVKDEPVKSVLVAAAFGVALTGLLLWLFQRDR